MLEHRSPLRVRAVSATVLILGVLGAGAAAGSGQDAVHGSVTAAGVPVPVGAMDEGVRVARTSGVAVSAPGHVGDGARIKVTGHVRVAKGKAFRPRPVSLQEQLDGLWTEVRHARADRYGHFALTSSGKVGPLVRTFRVTVGSGGTRLRPVTSERFAVQVGLASAGDTGSSVDVPGPMEVPAGDWDPAEYPVAGTPAPVGNPADWTWLWTGGARWNPCDVITWAYNATGGYAGSLGDAQRAFARLAGRTGLHFKYVGTTEVVYGSGAYPSGVDFLFGWSTAAHVGSLAGGVVGVGGGWAYGSQVGDVANKIVQGYVVLDSEGTLNGGFATSGMPTWGQVMQHEIGHALGLGHALGTTEVMYASVGSDNHLFGAGDLAGLARVGAGYGCL